MIARFTSRMHDRTYIRYLVASVGALGLDLMLFFALLHLHLGAAVANLISYSAGVVAHWLLSSRLVFLGRVEAAGPARWRQKAMFVASALVGLAVTTGIVALSAPLHVAPGLMKLVAIVISFQITYLIRAALVFASCAG